jgi:serum/glucocorticoid-regulated kinase 2
MATTDQDHLILASNIPVLKMLKKKGEWPERVIFSEYLIKINQRDRQQTRVMCITDKAIYNLMPSSYGKCKRRIKIANLRGVSASNISDEFVIHVPEEYDYHFKSDKKEKIVEVLKHVYAEYCKAHDMAQKVLPTKMVDKGKLKELAVKSKSMYRTMVREGNVARKFEDFDEDEDRENEEKSLGGDGEGGATEVEDMLGDQSGNEKVKPEDFDLITVLGRGTFGKVMQVKKRDTGKIYAMKILKKSYIFEKNQVDNTRAERRILQELQHPFLMKLRYAFQSKEKLYFVLDYYQGGELFFHLKANRRFNEETARVWVAEIGLALGHLHSLSVIYRDLKPENILLDEGGHLCLTDFGLSKDVSPDEKATTFCGTPEYLAPEVVSGVGHDKAVDWWSLGILLYELTVGIPPFYSQNVNEMYKKIQHGTLRFPPFLSEPCKAIIVALLSRDPATRLGSKNDVDDIKSHEFFKDMDWDALVKKEVDPGFKPKIDGTNCFDDVFTREAVVDSVAQVSKRAAANPHAFANFTFQEGAGHLGD